MDLHVKCMCINDDYARLATGNEIQNNDVIRMLFKEIMLCLKIKFSISACIFFFAILYCFNEREKKFCLQVNGLGKYCALLSHFVMFNHYN